MFQFPSFPTHSYVFTVRYLILHQVCSHIRRSAGRCLFTAHRSLSQLVTSFFGSWCQGIHLTLFFAWTYLFWFSNQIFLNCLSFVNKLGFFSLRIEKAFCALFVILNLSSTFRWNCTLPFTGKTYLILANLKLNLSSFYLFVLLFNILYSVFNEHRNQMQAFDSVKS